MRNGTLLGLGLALGAIVGAVAVESYRPVQDAVCKSKKMLKDKIDSMSNKHSF